MRKLWKSIPLSIKTYLKTVLIPMYRLIACLIPVDKKLIVFTALNGSSYSGSCRSVYEYMLENGIDTKFRIIWCIKKENMQVTIPGSAMIRPYKDVAYFLLCARAKVWISDSRNPDYMIKKKNQTYIQIWHGTPYKTLGLDIENLNMVGSFVGKKKYYDNIRANSSQWDYLVVQNDFSIPIFTRCFDFHKNILKTGYPRNDILFTKNNSDSIKKIKTKLGIPLDKKVILYAPTYRDNQYDQGGEYTFKSELDYSKMQKELANEYIMIVKYHYFIADKIDLSAYEGFIYSIDPRADIAELYLVADCLITDYSSVMFDYSLLHRPMYFYCYDLENYSNELRGCYFDLIEEAPGPISRNTDELIKDIKTPQKELAFRYSGKRSAFYSKYHTYENGTASERIVRLIEESCNARIVN